MKKGKISRCALPFHPSVHQAHSQDGAWGVQEDSQLWLDPLGWAGVAFPTRRSKERGTCARMGQLSAEGFVSPRAGDTQGTSARSAGGGGRYRKYQENKPHPAPESARGGFTQHARCDKKIQIFHGVLLSTGLCSGFSRAREWLQSQGIVPESRNGSRAKDWFQSRGIVPESGNGSRAGDWLQNQGMVPE